MKKATRFGVCVAAMELLFRAMATKEGNRVYSSEQVAQEMRFWLFGEISKCLKETDWLR